MDVSKNHLKTELTLMTRQLTSAKETNIALLTQNESLVEEIKTLRYQNFFDC
jgi:hypothetical protein